jgi:hypothetical protein
MGIEEVKSICNIPESNQKLLHRTMNIKRMPNLPAQLERCREAMAQFAEFVDQARQEGTLTLGHVNPQNPLNPANNALGGVAPNIPIDGVQVVAYINRLRDNLPDPPELHMVDTTISVLALLWVLFEVTPTFTLANENQVRVKTEDSKCQRGLVCLDDNCKGYLNTVTFPLGREDPVLQTGTCESVSVSSSCVHGMNC